MNAATPAFDFPQDLTQLTERCMRRLFERLECVLDACANLDNPKNVNATLRAVSLLLRLCTTVRARPSPSLTPSAAPGTVPEPECSADAGSVEPAQPLHTSATPDPASSGFVPAEAPFSTPDPWALLPLSLIGRTEPTPALLAAAAGLAAPQAGP